jgi:hypothetical protein
MSYFTWFGAVLGSALAHLGVVGYDLSLLSFPLKSNVSQFICKENVKGPLNVFACTLSGALLGHLTEVTWNVSIPTLLVFVLSYCTTEVNINKYFNTTNSSSKSKIKNPDVDVNVELEQVEKEYVDSYEKLGQIVKELDESFPIH